MRLVPCGLILLVTACASPLQPTPPVATRPAIWGLSGQSNAVGIHPYLEPYATIIGVHEGAQPIRAWHAEQRLWRELETALHQQPLTAFIWWQGEMDAYEGSTHYAADLTELLGRVRVLTSAPIVIVGLADMPDHAAAYAVIRRDQHHVATRFAAIYVSAEGVPIDGFHLTPEGYRVVAQRIAHALTSE